MMFLINIVVVYLSNILFCKKNRCCCLIFTEFSLVTPRILNCSAISMKSIKSSLLICTSPMYMKSKIARNTSPLTPLMKNTGCEHGFFYRFTENQKNCLFTSRLQIKNTIKNKFVSEFSYTLSISRKYGLQANKTNLCAPNCFPSHEKVISTKSDDSWIFLNSELTFILQHKQIIPFVNSNCYDSCVCLFTTFSILLTKNMVKTKYSSE